VDAAPPVEKRIAVDLVRHGLLIAPAVVLIAGLIRGVDGAASAALGLAVCLLNFLAAALSLEWGTRRSGNALFAVALGGFLFRMTSIVIVLVVAQALFGWVDILVLGLTLFITHLGLLFWELRSVSFSLAAPGLRRDRLAEDNRKGVAS
jgi:ATP synthase I chain